MLRENIKQDNVYNIALAFLFFLNVFFIFYRLDFADSLTDGSIYAVRSLSYTDYILPGNQTTPLQWFGYFPWWSRLSFHDAPPLVFIIQHIFFRIFGENIIALRLPFALSGVGAWFIVYAIGKKLFGKPAGILSVFILTVSTYFTWISRTAFLEGIELFFVTLSLYAFLIFLENPSRWLFLGVTVGLAFLTKYTSFFLIFFILLYMFFYQRKFFQKKEFYYACAAAFIIFSPVIIYNAMVFFTRGHFDAQFSRIFPSVMFKEAQRDWPVLYYSGSGGGSFISNFMSVFGVLFGAMSPIIFYYFLGALTYALYLALVRRRKEFGFIVIAFVSMLIIFTFLTPSLRLLPLFTPILALSFGTGVYFLFQEIQKRSMKLSLFFLILFIAILEAVYNIRTNLIVYKQGVSPKWAADISEKSFGFQELESYLLNFWNNDPIYAEKPRRILKYDELSLDGKKLRGNNVYLYDTDLNWFGRLWHLNRYYNYHGVFVFTEAEFSRILGAEINMLEALKLLGVKNVFYIKGLNDMVYTAGYKKNEKNRKYSDFLEGKFREYMPNSPESGIHDIENKLGEKAFRIFRLKL